MLIKDLYFRVELDKDASSPNPETAIWNAQHICVDLLDQRSKKDAQLEIQTLAEMIQQELENWCPTLSAWYRKNRMNHALLAP